VTFVTVAIILSVVFIVLMVDARDRVRGSEVEKLAVAEKVFTALDARRQQEQLAAVATVAENPTLKAALDTYFTESAFAGRAGAIAARHRDGGGGKTCRAYRRRRARHPRRQRPDLRHCRAAPGSMASQRAD
jgi:hypothetical protein